MCSCGTKWQARLVIFFNRETESEEAAGADVAGKCNGTAG